MADQTTPAPGATATTNKTFTFHLPDGRLGSVSAPADTTEEKAWGFLLQQHPEYGQQTKTAPPTDAATSEAEAFEQGAIFDPIKAVGQMLPASVSGAVSRAAPDWLKNYMAESAAGAEQHPGWRTAGNIAPFLLVPGAGESALANIALGAGAGLLQPVDPGTENFWTTKLEQGGLGGLTSWGLGALARRAARTLADQKAAAAAKEFWEQTPERATMNMYRRIANEVRDPSLIPSSITPQTSVEMRNKIGGILNQIYNRMNFDPMDPRWQTMAGSTYRTMRDTLANPDMQARWDRAFANDALAPVISVAKTRGLPISGEQLNQIVSDLGARASEFGAEAAKGGVYADQWRLMSEGMTRLRNAMTSQLDAANPALGAERRAATRAYHLADTMMRATTATKGGVAEPKDIIAALQRKVGKVQYASPRFGAVKNMLERERQGYEAKPPSPGPVNQLLRAMQHHAAREAAAAVGLPRWVGTALHGKNLPAKIGPTLGQAPAAAVGNLPMPDVNLGGP